MIENENSILGITGHIVAVLTHADGSVERYETHNLITTAGDLYYAQCAMGQTPTINFKTLGGIRLGSGSTTPVKGATDVTTFLAGTGHTVASGYPKTNDTDVANTGSGVNVCTWKYSYLTAEGNAVNIRELALVNSITSPTAASCHALFAAAFTKTSSDTLDLYVNHLFLGA